MQLYQQIQPTRDVESATEIVTELVTPPPPTDRPKRKRAATSNINPAIVNRQSTLANVGDVIKTVEEEDEIDVLLNFLQRK